MRTHLSRTWRWAVFGLVIAALVGGCGRPSGPPQSRPAPLATTTSTTPAPPLKYNSAQLPNCATIHAEVPGLPPPERVNDSTDNGIAPGRSCTFRGIGDDESYADLSVAAWEYSENAYGPQPGNKRAKEDFNRRATPQDEQLSDLGIGAEARWSDPDGGRAGCRLAVLDDNAVISVFYVSGEKDPPRGEQCRARATDLATQLYTAIQPQ
ncbi:hypothetical protein L3Q67_01980 [Saccharothrix sp. AJ9571]|nr:hypothetical protein L3Q67_01980 [Saccharothrix sp. AJ9571]